MSSDKPAAITDGVCSIILFKKVCLAGVILTRDSKNSPRVEFMEKRLMKELTDSEIF